MTIVLTVVKKYEIPNTKYKPEFELAFVVLFSLVKGSTGNGVLVNSRNSLKPVDPGKLVRHVFGNHSECPEEAPYLPACLAWPGLPGLAWLLERLRSFSFILLDARRTRYVAVVLGSRRVFSQILSRKMRAICFFVIPIRIVRKVLNLLYIYIHICRQELRNKAIVRPFLYILLSSEIYIYICRK